MNTRFSRAPKLSRWLYLGLFISFSVPAAPREADERENKAQADFAQATKAYNLGKFDEALKLYSEAYNSKPHPNFLFNIAQCYRQVGDFETAAIYYRRYRNEARLSVSDARVVDDIIAEVEAKQAERTAQQRLRTDRPRESPLQTPSAAAVRYAAKPEDLQSSLSIRPSTSAQPPRSDSILKKWWFWAGVGGLAAGVAIYAALPAHSRSTTLGSVNAR